MHPAFTSIGSSNSHFKHTKSIKTIAFKWKQLEVIYWNFRQETDLDMKLTQDDSSSVKQIPFEMDKYVMEP